MVTTAPPEKSELKVLVVDDNDSNIATLKGLLKYEGYTILTATNGAMALELAESALPDLILLDVKMPIMDGFEVCRRLKSSKETFQIPVIFLTVLSQSSEIVKGLEMGAADYVSKPFKPAELLARVRVHLQLKAAKDELKQNNLVLADRNDQLSLLNATKDKLLSIISHDLRAPMGTLTSSCQTMTTWIIRNCMNHSRVSATALSHPTPLWRTSYSGHATSAATSCSNRRCML